MKVLEIAGSNLASLKGDFRIRLDAPPFDREGLFAIRGATGAGKSTLIDALCLALYDDAPRFAGKGGPVVGLAGQKDGLRPTDPRNILRRGAGSGWAEAVFRGVDGARWRARWQVARARRKANGTFQTQEMSLENLDTGARFGGLRTEVLEHIRQKVGLSFEQFKRSVLLAQGEFAAFVKASSDDRAGLLEAMTGTDHYARISMAAHARRTLEVQRLNELRLRRDALGTLDSAVRADLETQQNTLEKEIVTHVARQQVVDSERSWHRQRIHLEAQVQGSCHRLQQALVALGGGFPPVSETPSWGEGTQLRAQSLQLRELAQAMLPPFKQELEAALQLDAQLQNAFRQCKDASDALKARQEKVRDAWEAAEKAQKQVREWTQEAEQHAQALQRSEDLQPLASLWPRVDKDLEAFETAFNDLGQVEQRLHEVREDVRQQQDACDACRKGEEPLEVERRSLQTRLEELGRQMDQTSRAELEQATRLQRASLQAFQDADRTWEDFRRAQQEREGAATAVAAHHKTQDEAEAELKDTARQRDEVAGALREARKALELAQAALGLEDRRAALQEGTPCPLCGALEHPWAQGSPLTDLCVKQGEQVERLAEQEQALERLRASAIARGKFSTEEASKAQQHHDRWCAELQRIEARWQALRVRLPELPHAMACEEALLLVQAGCRKAEDGLATLTSASHALLEQETEAKRLREQLQALHGQRVDLEEALRNAIEELHALKLEEATLVQRKAALVRQRDDLQQILAPLLKEADLPALEQAPGQLRMRLGKAVEARLRLETALEQLNFKLRELAPQVEGLRATAVAQEDAFALCQRQETEAQEALEQLQRMRGELLQGRAVAEVRDLYEVATNAQAVLSSHGVTWSEHEKRETLGVPLETLEQEALALNETLDTLRETLGGVRANVARDGEARVQAEALERELQAQEARVHLWEQMHDLVGSSDGRKFRGFAQSLTLESLLGFANGQLARLAPRYRLERVPSTELELQVVDQDMGQEIRALTSLSGGETFLVSLALALGLSALSACDTPIESLFIDEGFGTLDADTLETALSVLDELQSQGRQVGIISHVDGLAAHIPVQIRVEKCGGGSSQVLLPASR